MRPLFAAAIATLLIAAGARAETATCPNGSVWAGNNFLECPCCTQCPDGAWTQAEAACGVRDANDCVRYAKLVPALGIANPLAESAHNIRPRNRVDVWEKSSSAGKGALVGHIATGARVKVLDGDATDLLVQLPGGGEFGWISREHVVYVAIGDIATGALCGAR
jgi:hypothetical protein